MDALHSSNDSQLAHTHDIFRTQMLSVLVAPAPVGLVGIRRKGPFVDVDQLLIGSITNCVNADLEIVQRCQPRGLFHRFH